MKRLLAYVLTTTVSLGLPFAAGFAHDGDGSASASAYVAGKDGDPGTSLYKSGYSEILEEQWVKARKTFADLLKRFPKSAYADDARYWSAYAQMHLDRRKALVEYREFINRHPRSAYLGDAVADLGNLERDIQAAQLRTEVEQYARQRGDTDSLMRDSKQRMMEAQKLMELDRRLMTVPQTGVIFDTAFHRFHPVVVGEGPSVDGMEMRGFAMSMKRLGWRLRRAFRTGSESELDKQTQVRLEALSAIGHGEEDDRGFATLKDVALDHTQPDALRVEAMNQLAEFTKHDATPVFLEIAKTDTNAEIQSESLDHLRQSLKDKDKSVQTLATLYQSLPSARSDQRSMILYEVADIGNDPAVAFLSTVARHDSSYDLRSEAVYYLGNIGGEKARAVLYDVLLNK